MEQLFLMMGASSGSSAGGGSLLSFLPLIAVVVVMYFFMIRPQAKRQKEHKAMLDAVAKGDKIVTSGGIIGTVAGVRETEQILIVKIADNVKIEVSRGSVSQVLNKKDQA